MSRSSSCQEDGISPIGGIHDVGSLLKSWLVSGIVPVSITLHIHG